MRYRQMDWENKLILCTLTTRYYYIKRDKRSVRRINIKKAAKQERWAAERKWVKTLGKFKAIFWCLVGKSTIPPCAWRNVSSTVTNFSSAGSYKELFRATYELLGKNATLAFQAASLDQHPLYVLDFYTSKITKIREDFDVSNGNFQHPYFTELYLSNYGFSRLYLKMKLHWLHWQ